MHEEDLESVRLSISSRLGVSTSVHMRQHLHLEMSMEVYINNGRKEIMT
jgi:hypothetical protein